MTAKQKYRELCRVDTTIPVFSKDWWMDAVCGDDNWDVLLVEKGGQIVASMPIYFKRKFGLKYVTQGKLTQTNGVWIKYPVGQNYEKRLSYEKEVMNEIINQIEELDIVYFQQNFHYEVVNWLPFYWRGYKQTTKYTYVIDDLSDVELLLSEFGHSKRKNVNKARKNVIVNFDLDAKSFYENHKLTLGKQGLKISYSFDLFKRLYAMSYENNAGKTIYALDENNNIHSALFIVWDDCSAYNLISTIDPDYRSSGSSDLLVYEAIKFVSSKTAKFDFEGSMIEGVENSFRRFGTVQKPYFAISKTFKYKLAFSIYQSIRER